jgi:hypothetical protein
MNLPMVLLDSRLNSSVYFKPSFITTLLFYNHARVSYSESGQQVGLANTRVTNNHNFE